MERVTYRQFLAFVVVSVSGSLCARGENPTFSVLIAAKNGVPIVPPAVSVSAAPGEVLTVELFLRCWSNGHRSDNGGAMPLLRGYQATYNCSSYTSGSAGNTLPLDFGLNPPNPASGFIDDTRSDFILTCANMLTAVNIVDCGYGYIATGFPLCGGEFQLCPPEEPEYCGTMRLHVSPDAAGTFMICLDDSDDDGELGPDLSLLAPTLPSNGVRILPLDFECATITVAGSEPLGACCRKGLPCADGLTQAACESLGGTFQGDGSTCTAATCVPPPMVEGACCLGHICLGVVTPGQCDQVHGAYQGDGTTCAEVVCVPAGACCLGAVCGEAATEEACEAWGGVYQGDGTSCDDVSCGPHGACCILETLCIPNATATQCQDLNGIYRGDDSSCGAGVCPPLPRGACCLPDLSCQLAMTQAECQAAGGLYQGDKTSCAETVCGIPTVTHWGVAVMSLLLLSAAKIRSQRRLESVQATK